VFWLQNACTWAPTGFFPGGHRRRKGSVFGGHHDECGARAYNGGLGAKPPWSWKHFGHWMSNGAGKFSPFPKMHLYFYSRCNGNDMGICRNTGGSGDPLPGGAHAPALFFLHFGRLQCHVVLKTSIHRLAKVRNPNFAFDDATLN